MSPPQRISAFFSARHLGPWRFENGFNLHLSLSGTDRPFLWLAGALAHKGWSLDLFCDNLPLNAADEMLRFVRPAENLVEAVRASSASGARLLIANANDPCLLEAACVAELSSLTLLLWDQNGPRPELVRFLTTIPSLARLVCVSQAQADGARHLDCFEKISVVYNAIDLDFWHPIKSSEIEPAVVFLGALTPSKGFHHLARAWPVIKRAHPRARLHVCGSAKLYDRNATVGPLGIALEAYEREGIMPYLGESLEAAEALGVQFHGLTTPVQTRSLLWTSSIGVVNPNIDGSSETFCVSAVEMQACGLPVVGGCVGGLLETVAHGRSGVLLQPAQLAHAICRVLGDRPFRARLSQGAIAHAAQFGPTKTIVEWENLLGAILANRRLQSPPFRVFPLKSRRYAKQLLRLSRLQRLVRSWRG